MSKQNVLNTLRSLKLGQDSESNVCGNISNSLNMSTIKL